MSRANGFRFSVPGLVSAQNKLPNVQAGLLNIADEKYLKEKEVNEYDFLFFSKYNSTSNLIHPFSKPDIVIFHGIYHLEYISLYKDIIKKNIPYIVVPRVSLTKGAQHQKFIKKKVGNFLVFNKFLKNAKKIHYLTENEKNTSIRFRKKSFVVGNGTDMPDEFSRPKNKNLIITYIGRMDLNHKGLDILIKEINKIKDRLISEKVSINFYGSDFRNGKKYLNDFIKKNKLEKICFVHPPIFGEDKKKILKKSNIFISTSRFEGHPMAVIEAMAYGIPCILTSGTNMLSELNKYNAGWETDLYPNSISSSIIDSMRDNDLMIQKGKNARKLVEDNYSWNEVARETLLNYKKVMMN